MLARWKVLARRSSITIPFTLTQTDSISGLYAERANIVVANFIQLPLVGTIFSRFIETLNSPLTVLTFINSDHRILNPAGARSITLTTAAADVAPGASPSVLRRLSKSVSHWT